MVSMILSSPLNSREKPWVARVSGARDGRLLYDFLSKTADNALGTEWRFNLYDGIYAVCERGVRSYVFVKGTRRLVYDRSYNFSTIMREQGIGYEDVFTHIWTDLQWKYEELI
jgi:hypothetical protein